MTTWPARRSSQGLLCGRQVAGRYVCQGLIGYVLRDPQDPSLATRAILPPGMTEDPPGSGFWRPTTRAATRAAQGQDPLRNQRRRMSSEAAMPGPFSESLTLPWRRACPHCGAIALVNQSVLSS